MRQIACCLFITAMAGWSAAQSAREGTLADRAFQKLRDNPPVCASQFDFVVVADTRSSKPVTLPPEFFQMINEWNILKPALVVDIGDLILGGAAEGVGPQWDEFIRAAGTVDAPFFPVVGNHDVTDPATEAIYTERIGPLCFAFSYGHARFIALNSEEQGAVGRLSDAQVAWLKDDLSQTRAQHIFLFLHRPYFSRDWDAQWGNVAEAIRGYPVRVVFGAHDHLYRSCGERDGVQYVITGGGGAGGPTPEEEGGFPHYLWVRVRGDQVDWSVIRPGNVLPADVVTQDRINELRLWEAAFAIDPQDAPHGQGFDRQLVLRIQNPRAEAFSGTLAWDVPPGWHVDPVLAEYHAAPDATTDVPFRIWSDTPAAARFPVPSFTTSVPVARFGGPVTVSKEFPFVPRLDAVYAAEPVRLDGVLDEWTRAPAYPLDYAHGFDISNTGDLTSQVRLMWDEGHTYLAVETHDNEFNQPYAGDIVWSADNVELFLNGWEWSLTLTPKGEEVFLYEGPGRESETVNTTVQLAVKLEGERVVYEAVFPASEVAPLRLQPGESFPFSLIMNDLDLDGPRHWLEITPGAGSSGPFPQAKAVLTKP
jgi:hypothetical protein